MTGVDSARFINSFPYFSKLILVHKVVLYRDTGSAEPGSGPIFGSVSVSVSFMQKILFAHTKDTFCGSVRYRTCTWFWFANPTITYQAQPCLLSWAKIYSWTIVCWGCGFRLRVCHNNILRIDANSALQKVCRFAVLCGFDVSVMSARFIVTSVCGRSMIWSGSDGDCPGNSCRRPSRGEEHQISQTNRFDSISASSQLVYGCANHVLCRRAMRKGVGVSKSQPHSILRSMRVMGIIRLKSGINLQLKCSLMDWIPKTVILHV